MAECPKCKKYKYLFEKSDQPFVLCKECRKKEIDNYKVIEGE